MSDIKKQLSELVSSLPVSTSTEMKASVRLVEMYGKVRIVCDIDSRYPIQGAVEQVSQSRSNNFINHLILQSKRIKKNLIFIELLNWLKLFILS